MQTIEIKREYDYIVVGSGAGGAPVAANLARAGYRVLVLEAGGRHAEKLETKVPAFHGKSSEDPDIRWDYWVDHYSDEKRQKRDPKYHPNPNDEQDPKQNAYYKADKTRRGILYPRCSAVGGCTVHNAMICIYPHNSDWNRIADLVGDESWRGKRMRRYYERLERCQYGFRNLFWSILRGFLKLFWLPFNPGRRGFDGWLATSRADTTLLLRDKQLKKIVKTAIKQTAKERVGNILTRISRGLDPNAWATIQNRGEGVALTPVNIDVRTGSRSSPRELLLKVEKEHPDRLIIKTDALVKRVLFDHNRAIGVEYVEGANLYRAHVNSPKPNDNNRINTEHLETHSAYVTREVILSAGAFNTPQILMLSGIGPKDQLKEAGFNTDLHPLSAEKVTEKTSKKTDEKTENKAPIAILEGVGKNLQDRYEVCVVTDMNSDFDLSEGAQYEPDSGDRHYKEWIEQGTGIYASNGSVIAVVKRSKRSRPDPDLYIFGIVGDFQGYEPEYSRKAIARRDRFTWVVLKAHTNGRAGSVTLRSCNFWDTPKINFRYFDDDEGQSGWEEDVESVVEGVNFVRRMNKSDNLDQLIESEVSPGSEIQTDEELTEFIKDHAWGHHCSCTCQIGPFGKENAVLDSNFRVHGVRNLRVVDASVFPTIPGLFIVSAIYMVAEKASDAILADAKRSEVVQGLLAPQLAAEVIALDEAETIERIIGLLKQKLADDYYNLDSLRDTHPKSNGLVRAKFIVEPTLQEKYRVGIFRHEEKTFDALVRFSNSAPEFTRDIEGDFRGIAVKLLGVSEEEFGEKLLDDEKDTHDFLMLGLNRFFAANPRDFADFFNTVINGKFSRWFGRKRGRAVDVFLGYLLKRLRFRQALAFLVRRRLVFGSPLEIAWFGISPYRFGTDQVVKYSIQPTTFERTPIPKNPSDDYLRDTMTQQLKNSDFDLDFSIQFRTHPECMPIEDTSVPWDETLSPFVKVATLRVIQQDFNSDARLELDENLSFNPWHCIEEHRPIGAINRARRPVMKALSDFRLERNKIERKEPTVADLEASDSSSGQEG